MYCETAKVDESLAKEIEKEMKVCLPLVHLEAVFLCPGGGNGSGFWWSEQ